MKFYVLKFSDLDYSFSYSIIGCASAHKQTVEAAEITDLQIAAMQVSHEKLVSLYYARLRDGVNNFIQQQWVPLFLTSVISAKGEQGKEFRHDLDVAYNFS